MFQYFRKLTQLLRFQDLKGRNSSRSIHLPFSQPIIRRFTSRNPNTSVSVPYPRGFPTNTLYAFLVYQFELHAQPKAVS